MTTETRTFTPDQANRMLPLVSRIVEDIVRDFARWREKVDLFELEVARLRPGESGEIARLESEAQDIAAEVDKCVDELHSLGIEFKGFDVGLVDFPAEMDGRPVYLCWKLGEPAVRYWHEMDAGYAGRRPLDAGASGFSRGTM